MSFSSWFKKSLVVAAIVSVGITYRYLPQAMSILDVTITMNRNQATEQAQQVMTAKNLFSQDYSTATYFNSDSKLQYFIELAGGGKEVYKDLLKNHMIEPYLWIVRFYKEGVIQEGSIAFTPTGIPHSFKKKMAETDVLPNLTEQEARAIAQEEAASNWNIDFSVYKPLEYSKQEQPSKRIDHTFTYQREDVAIGKEGKYRVTIVVSGNTVTQISPFVFIPESFVRRYEEMRAENITLCTLAVSLFRLLYLFGGIVLLGGVLLYRRQLTYAHALWVAIVLGILTMLELLSEWPFLFISYNTALSQQSFLLTYALNILQSGFLTFLTMFIFAAVAHALDKWIFPQHESMWNFFSWRGAARRKMVWYVFGAYLGAAIKLAYVTGAYLFLTGPYVGWWSPASTLVDPNVLAQLFPWVAPMLYSFKAGFSEELLFRVIPLAGAVIIGRFFKQEKLFIVLGIFVQALIFTAAHASYVTYPAYFRVVEIFLSAVAYGILYLRCGLIPAIIMHWIYDLVLMSLPIMVSSAPGMMVQKLIVIFCALFPLAYVLYVRYKTRDLVDTIDEIVEEVSPVSSDTLSDRDIALFFTQSYDQGKSIVDRLSSSTKIMIIAMMALMFAGLSYGLYTSHAEYYRTPIASKEVICADSYKRLMDLNPQFAQNSKQLYCLSSHANGSRPRSSFVWRTNSHETYFSLADKYVYPIWWATRYARFTGTQLERAEEYCFMYNKAGELLTYIHKLADQTPGAQLQEEQARKLAHKAISEWFSLDAAILKEVNCQSTKKPDRIDWNFVFENPAIVLSQGSARIEVVITGDQLGTIQKFIFVPEDWLRANNQEELYIKIVSAIISALFFLLVLVGLGYLKRPAIAIFNKKLFVAIAVLLALGFMIVLYCTLPETIFNFSTSVAWNNQLLSFFTPKLVLYCILIFFGAWGVVCSYYSCKRYYQHRSINWYATSMWILFFGITQSCMQLFIPTYYPLLGNPALTYNSYYPVLFLLVYTVIQLVQSIVYAYVSIVGLNTLTQFGTRYRLLSIVLFPIIMMTVIDGQMFSSFYLVPLLMGLVLLSIVSAILYYTVVRYDSFSFLLGYSFFIILNQILDTPYPYSLYLFIVSGFIGAGYFMYRRLAA